MIQRKANMPLRLKQDYTFINIYKIIMSLAQIHEEDFKIYIGQQRTNNQVKTRLRVSNSSLHAV